MLQCYVSWPHQFSAKPCWQKSWLWCANSRSLNVSTNLCHVHSSAMPCQLVIGHLKSHTDWVQLWADYVICYSSLSEVLLNHNLIMFMQFICLFVQVSLSCHPLTIKPWYTAHDDFSQCVLEVKIIFQCMTCQLCLQSLLYTYIKTIQRLAIV